MEYVPSGLLNVAMGVFRILPPYDAALVEESANTCAPKTPPPAVEANGAGDYSGRHILAPPLDTARARPATSSEPRVVSKAGAKGNITAPHHGRVVESEKVADLVSGNGLQILPGTASGRELRTGVEEDVGVEYLPGEGRSGAVFRVLAGNIGTCGERDGERVGFLGEVSGANEADQIDAVETGGGERRCGTRRNRKRCIRGGLPRIERRRYDIADRAGAGTGDVGVVVLFRLQVTGNAVKSQWS